MFVKKVSQVISMRLEPLTLPHISALLQDTLRASEEKVSELSKWVYSKTGVLEFFSELIYLF
jgi:hypothetical protein